jgi:hypothetical protein
MDIVTRKYCLALCILLVSLFATACGGVSTDTLHSVWSKQVQQEVTPLMKDVFAPISSQVSSELIFYSDADWDISDDPLPDYKYGLQHAKETVNGDLDPLLLIRVQLNQAVDESQIHLLQEQVWSAVQQLKINGIQSGKIKLEHQGKVYFSGWIQSINRVEDVSQFLLLDSKG